MQAQAEDNYVLFSCEGAKDTEDRMFVMDSGASMHNAEQGELSSDTMDTLRRSKTPYATYRDRGAVQINEYAPDFVHDLDLFATVQLLDQTPAILLPHQLCSKRGYSCE